MYKASQLEQIIENAPGPVWTLDRDCVLIHCNKKSRDFFRRAFHTTLKPGDSFTGLLSARMTENWTRRIDAALRGKHVVFEEILQTEDQEQRVYSFFMDPVRESGQITGISVYSHDVTPGEKSGKAARGYRRALEALRESNRKLDFLMDSLPGMVYCRSDNRNCTMHFVSGGTYDLTGYKPEEIIEDRKISYEEIIHPGDREMVRKIVSEHLEKKDRWTMTYRIINKKGYIVWIWEQGRGIFDPLGNLLHLEGFATNVSDYMEAERELLKMEEKHRVLFSDARKDKQNAELQILQLSRIVEQSPVAVVIINTGGVIEYANHKFSEITGCRRNEITGKKSDIFRSGTIAPEIREEIRKTIHSGNEWKGEFMNMKKDGSPYWESATISPVTGPDNRIIRFIRISEDITAYKKIQSELEESERHYKELYMEAPMGYQSLDGEGCLLNVNKAWEKLTGYTQKEIAGKPFAEILTRDSTGVFSEEEIHETDLEIIRKDGSTVAVTMTGKIIQDRKRKTGITHCILHDISERRIYEKKLLEAKEQAEKADRLKTRFLTNMSHEIRTPMNAILGFSNLLKSGSVQEKDRDRYFNIIHTKGNNLVRLIDNIIFISRIEAGDIRIRKNLFGLDHFLENIHRKILQDPRIQDQAQISVLREFPEPIHRISLNTDQNKLAQVMDNLVSNAIKFTEQGMIKLGAEITENQQVMLYIKDTGAGIPQSKQNVIFERFRQADDGTTRMYEGAGLGLAISKSLMKLLEGDLTVESASGQGTVFYVSIPWKHVIMEQKEKTVRPEGKKDLALDLTGKKILIAEDDYPGYLFLKTILNRSNAAVVRAVNGKETIECFRKQPDTDLILMDIRMPEMDGFEATRIIRSMDSEVPIIAQTAHAFPEDRIRALESGCNKYIAKPIAPVELEALLAELLGLQV